MPEIQSQQEWKEWFGKILLYQSVVQELWIENPLFANETQYIFSPGRWGDVSCRYTVEPRYNEVLGTMKITLLYQVSHYIRVKKQRNIKSWDQQNYLVIRGFCYIQPLYNEVPLYHHFKYLWKGGGVFISYFFFI